MNTNINESRLWEALRQRYAEVSKYLGSSEITLSISLSDEGRIPNAFVHYGCDYCEQGDSIAAAAEKVQVLIKNKGMQVREKRERANQLLREADELEKLMHHADSAAPAAPAQP